MEVKVKNLVEVPLSWLSDGLVESIKKSLTFAVKNYIDNQYRDSVVLYEVTDSVIKVPRFFALSYLSYIMHNCSNETAFISSPIQFDYTLDTATFAKEQNQLVEYIVQDFKDKAFYGGIVWAPTGYGKTVVGLKLAHKLQVKTAVLVHRQVLLNQWVEMIRKYCGFEPSIVQGNIDDVSKDITVMMIQTLLNRLYSDDFANNFGLVIVDEVHHLSAPVWCKVAKLFNARYTLGLTATPKRSDGLDNIFRYTIGLKTYSLGELNVRGAVKVYRISLFVPSFISDDRTRVMPRFISWLVKNRKYREFVIMTSAKELDKDNVYALILADRLQFVDEIYDYLSKRFKGQKVVHKLVSGSKIVPADIYVGTYQYCSEGVDIPLLNTLVLATPRFNIKQACGRLFRQLEKKYINIIDFATLSWPTSQDIDNMYYARIKTYQMLGLNLVITNA